MSYDRERTQRAGKNVRRATVHSTGLQPPTYTARMERFLPAVMAPTSSVVIIVLAIFTPDWVESLIAGGVLALGNVALNVANDRYPDADGRPRIGARFSFNFVGGLLFIVIVGPQAPGWLLTVPGCAAIAIGLRGVRGVLGVIVMTSAAVLTTWHIGAGFQMTVYAATILGVVAVLVVGIAESLRREHAVTIEAFEAMEVARAERRAAERAAERSERLASLGTLAAGVAHEINNPLAFVSMNLSYVGGALPSGVDEELRDAIDDARDGARRIADVVRDMHLFARSDDNTIRGAIDVAQVANAAVNMVQNEIRHRAKLRVDLEDLAPVNGNPSRLGQVLVNLLINAAHSIEEGAVAENEVALVSHVDPTGRVRIDISDTGCGIDEEALGRIFDPFYTSKPVGAGTGLGLPIAQGIIAEMGGEILAQSRAGHGSLFSVLLPTAAADAATIANQARPGTLEGLRILAIDDEPNVIRALKRALEGAHVTGAGGGLEALEILQSDDSFDMVLCDLMMTDLSGMALFKRIESLNPDLARRFVFMTGGAFTPVARQFVDTVRNTVLTKPIKHNELVSVAELLSQQPTRSAG